MELRARSAVDRRLRRASLSAAKTLRSAALGARPARRCSLGSSSRTTLYVVTSRRVVMKVGIALPIFFNLPFSRSPRRRCASIADGTGDIPVALSAGAAHRLSCICGRTRVRSVSPIPSPRCAACPTRREVAETLEPRADRGRRPTQRRDARDGRRAPRGPRSRPSPRPRHETPGGDRDEPDRPSPSPAPARRAARRADRRRRARRVRAGPAAAPARLTDVGTVHMPRGQAVETLALRFEDQRRRRRRGARRARRRTSSTRSRPAPTASSARRCAASRGSASARASAQDRRSR